MKNTNYFLLAKRLNNQKRPYLLVNPLQAKHCPVSPRKALDMMRELGEKVREAFPDTGLVIGFAETATAIGLSVAGVFPGCRYYQTTREDLPGNLRHIDFLEEHSHAVNQRLYLRGLKEAIADARTVVFVDDEISTGKTLINMLGQLENEFPELREKKKVLASVINRVTDENLDLLSRAGFTCVQLQRVPNEDYSDAVSSFRTSAPVPVPDIPTPDIPVETLHLFEGAEPRLGVDAKEYSDFCDRIAEKLIGSCRNFGERILILGTEECMFPAIRIGERIEQTFPHSTVVTHSTTRSPISLSDDDGYPIRNGYRIHSFYDGERINYLYHAASYDSVILVSDSANWNSQAEKDIVSLFSFLGCGNFYIIRH